MQPPDATPTPTSAPNAITPVTPVPPLSPAGRERAGRGISAETPTRPLAAYGTATMRRRGLGYVYRHSSLQVEITVDHLTRHGPEYHGMLYANTLQQGRPPHLIGETFNLSSGRTRRDLAKRLSEKLRSAPAALLEDVIEQVCMSVIADQERGDQAVFVPDITLAQQTQTDLVDKLLPRGKPTWWYGEPGVGKGWLAVFTAVCVQTGTALCGLPVQQGPVVYADWEDDASVFHGRVAAVSAGLGLAGLPRILYLPCKRPLPDDLHRIARWVAQTQAVLLIVDSVSLAAGAPGDRATYHMVAAQFIAALRELEPCTTLCIDHTGTAEWKSASLAGRAMGSGLKKAESRAAWEIRHQSDAGSNLLNLAAFHTKGNHSETFQPLGWQLEFGSGRPPSYVRFTTQDVRDNPDLAQALPLVERITNALREGPGDLRALADRTGLAESQLRPVLFKYKNRFVLLPPDRSQWALVAPNRDSPTAGGRIVSFDQRSEHTRATLPMDVETETETETDDRGNGDEYESDDPDPEPEPDSPF